MIKKGMVCAVMLSLLLIAGCSKAKTPSEKIMATVGGVGMPYAGYRDYIDATDAMNRESTLRNIAFCAALEKDLSDTISRETFEAQYSYQVMSMMQDTSYAKIVEKIKSSLKLTDKDVQDLLLELYWPQYLSEVMDEKITAEADASGQSADELWNTYENSVHERIQYGQGDNRFLLDGTAVEASQLQKNLIAFSGLSSRIDTINYIALLSKLNQNLGSRGLSVDYSGFDNYYQQTLNAKLSDETYAELLPLANQKLGITQDQFNTSFKAYLKLQYSADSIVSFLEKEYNSMTDTNKPSSAQEYINNYVEELYNSIQVVDLA